ncbi:MAG: hypothetical protein CMK32_07390 [Porticoccaceae bacterium]|nr:hypothetical protein [Porticoccaceae bacterium]
MQPASVTECYRRIQSAIDGESNQRNRQMLEIYRRHWWGEVTNDMDLVMSTLPADKVHYRFDGHPFVMGEGLEFFTTTEARQMYQRVIDLGDNMAGPFADERWAFSDWGLVFAGILYGLYSGKMFAGRIPDLEPDQKYLVSYRSVSLHPMDCERGLMLGELVYSGRLQSVEKASDQLIEALMDY